MGSPYAYLWQQYLANHPDVVANGKKLVAYMNTDETDQFKFLEGRFVQLMTSFWPWSYNLADKETEVQTWQGTVDMGSRFLIYAATGDEGYSGRTVTIGIILPSLLQEPTTVSNVSTYFAALKYFQDLRTQVLSRVHVALGALPGPNSAATTVSGSSTTTVNTTNPVSTPIVSQSPVNQNSPTTTLVGTNPTTAATVTPVISAVSTPDYFTQELVMGIIITIAVGFLLSRS